jgi:hypothetical protein
LKKFLSVKRFYLRATPPRRPSLLPQHQKLSHSRSAPMNRNLPLCYLTHRLRHVRHGALWTTNRFIDSRHTTIASQFCSAITRVSSGAGLKSLVRMIHLMLSFNLAQQQRDLRTFQVTSIPRRDEQDSCHNKDFRSKIFIHFEPQSCSGTSS